MSAYADLIRWVLALALAAGLVLFGRSCGKSAGLADGADERAKLSAEGLDLSNRLNGCITSVNFANAMAEQEQAEAARQKALAEQAAARALLAEQERVTKVAALQKQLAEARKNPDAAAQLDTVLHPSIPIR